MSSLTRNAKILLAVGLILIVLCAIGIIMQASVYSEYAGDKPFSFHADGPANGARGGFMQSLVAWNHSDQAKAKQASDIIVFLAIGAALGCLMIWRALRPQKAAAPAEDEEAARRAASSRRRTSTRTTWK